MGKEDLWKTVYWVFVISGIVAFWIWNLKDVPVKYLVK